MHFICEPQIFNHTRIRSCKMSWKICSTDTTDLICMRGGDSTEVWQLVAHFSSLILGSFCQHVAWLQSAPELWEVKTRFQEAGHGKPLYTMKKTYSVEGLWSTMSGCWQLLTARQCEESQFEVFDHVHNHYCSFCIDKVKAKTHCGSQLVASYCSLPLNIKLINVRAFV